MQKSEIEGLIEYWSAREKKDLVIDLEINELIKFTTFINDNRKTYYSSAFTAAKEELKTFNPFDNFKYGFSEKETQIFLHRLFQKLIEQPFLHQLNKQRILWPYTWRVFKIPEERQRQKNLLC